MKKTKLLVMTASIVFGVGFSVYAKLPINSIVVGKDVYSISYFTNDSSGTNTAKVNEQLANNLGNIYYVDDTGIAKDMFTGSTVQDSAIIDKLKSNTLTYYPGNGTTEKIVADASNNFMDPTTANGGYAIVHLTYKQLPGSLYLFTCQLSQLSGVSGAANFQVGSSPMTSLSNLATYMGQLSTGTSNLIHFYASDGVTELANGYLNLNTNGNTSGDVNLTVNLQLTGNSTGVDPTTKGNMAYNISNNGFATIDKDGKWIYYSNTGDGGKLYRKSVSGTYDFPISNDNAKYINVVGDWIYYSNYDDGGKIYKVQKDGTERQKVSDDMASSINVVGDSIYYIDHDDNDRIYVQNSDGKKMLLNDRAQYLSVTGNFLFYINPDNGNKLYSYDIKNSNNPVIISTVDTKFINACSDYLIFYTGNDGILYRSVNAQGQLPVPMTVTTNVALKSSKNSEYNALTDTATIICAVDDNNIYYISNRDSNKIYKLDNTGNGYKVVDDSADFMNIIGDNLYYMKSGKVFVASKDGDGTKKGVDVKKPKLTTTVKTINDLPTFTTDDITKFNFPESVSCIMSDGSQQTLVVSWDKTIPKPSNGVYTFKGTILGYGNAVNMKVALDSGTINTNNVKIVNNIGNKDTVNITGLTSGDVVNLYNSSSDLKSLKSATADSNGNVNITGLGLSEDGGNLYITVTKTGRVEGNKVAVQYQAESPVGFAVDAANQNITGLKPDKFYKVYIQDEKPDGTIPALDGLQITGVADNNGILNVPTMIDRIDGNKDEKQMLRVVATGTVDSSPSSSVEISRGKVPDYVSIDLNLGRITGTTTGMLFTYDDPQSASASWNVCQGGSTPIAMTRSLKVSVKVQGSGPVIESKAVSYGLFPSPVINGITDGGTYTTKIDPSTGKSLFPIVSWNSNEDDGNSSINYTATLTKDGVPVSSPTSGEDLINKITGDGSYVLTVTGTKTVTGMGSASNSTTVKFIVSSAVPAPVDIKFLETAGKSPSNKVPTYYQATPTWVSLAGTIDTPVVQRVDYSDAIVDPKDDLVWKGVAKVAFTQNSTISQDGYYKITVTSTSRENGATNVSTKVFRVDTVDKALPPSISGVTEGGIYKEIAGINKNEADNCITVGKIMRNGYNTDYTFGEKITVNGKYVLQLDTTNSINGAAVQKTINFEVNDQSDTQTPDAPDAPTGVTFIFNDDGTAKLAGVDTGEEYSLNDGQSWTPVTSSGTQMITSVNELNLLNGTSKRVQIRYRANGNIPASNPQTIQLEPSPAAPTLTFSFGGYDVSGKLIGKFSGDSIESCQYSVDGGLTWKNTETDGSLQSGDADNINTTNGIWVRVKASGQTKPSLPEKIGMVQASAPSVTTITVSNGVKLSSKSTGLEYRVNTGNTKGTWKDFESDEVISDAQAGSIDVRSKAVGTAMPGYITTITVQAAPSAIIDYANEKITGVNGSTMQWSTDGTTWNTFTGSSIDLKDIIPASGTQSIYITYIPTDSSVSLTQANLNIKARPEAIDEGGIEASITTSTGVIKIGGLIPSQVSAYEVVTSSDGATWSSVPMVINSTDSNGYGSITASTGVRYIKIRVKATATNFASEYSHEITLTAGTASAKGTITFGTPQNGDTVTVGGETFTKADNNTGNNFVTADDLTAGINALSNVDATNAGGIITVMAAQVGTSGNSIQLSSTGGRITVSGSTLAGGQ